MVDWIRFKVGDLVTRDGTDVHRVTRVDKIDDGQCIEVECIRAPESGWTEVGERENNLARRYERAKPLAKDKRLTRARKSPSN